MGGLVARERFRLDRMAGVNRNVGALITLGTPHRGAKVIRTLLINRSAISTMFGIWVIDLCEGPDVLL